MISRISTSLALLIASTIMAQAEVPGVIPDDLRDAFNAAMTSFKGQHPAVESEAIDLNQSGVAEVLLREAGDCANAICAWSLLSYDGDQVFQVTSGEGRDPHLVPTGEAGGLLSSDSVTWAFDGYALYPYGDVISMEMNRATSEEEFAFLAAMPDFQGLTRDQVMSWTFAYMRDGEIHHADVHTITGWEFQVGSWGTPYVIRDRSGEVIARGYSTDHPRVFPDDIHGGFTVVELVPAGYSLQTFE